MRRQKGFAMALFILTLLVLGSISASMIFITSSDRTSSQLSNAKIIGRVEANAVSDLLFSKILDNGNLVNQIVDVDQCKDLVDSTKFPGLNCNGQFTNYASMNKGMDAQGNLATAEGKLSNSNCLTTNLKEDCVAYYVKTYAVDVTTNRITAIKLFIRVKSGCNLAGKKCRFTTYSNLLRPAQFFDYLYYVKYTTLDPLQYGSFSTPSSENCKVFAPRPSYCIDVALTERDAFGDKIYTFDNYFSVCGLDSGKIPPSRIYSRGSSTDGQAIKSLTSSGYTCPSPEPTGYTNSSAVSLDLSLKGNAIDGVSKIISGNNGVKVYNLGQGSADLAMSSTGTSITCSGSCNGNNTISLTGSGGNNRANIISIGGNISIGDPSVVSYLEGKVSIVASGNITIKGDIKYKNGASSSNTKDVLSLIADNNIIIVPPNPSTCSEPVDRSIDAFMLSVNNAIIVKGATVDDDWTSDRYSSLLCPPNYSPVLRIYGSVVGKYQPIFGSYDMNGAGQTFGYSKDFIYDSRVRDNKIQIPYVIPPQTQQWFKLGLTEIASNY